MIIIFTVLLVYILVILSLYYLQIIHLQQFLKINIDSLKEFINIAVLG